MLKCENCCYFACSEGVEYEHCCFHEWGHSYEDIAPCDEPEYDEPNDYCEEFDDEEEFEDSGVEESTFEFRCSSCIHSGAETTSDVSCCNVCGENCGLPEGKVYDCYEPEFDDRRESDGWYEYGI